MKPLYGLEDRPPPRLTLFLGLQHVLAMFIGIVTPPLLVGTALGLDAQETAFLISMSLFASGLNTFIQVHRLGPLGSGLLSVQGTSFVFVGMAIQCGKAGGMPLVFGCALLGAIVPIVMSRYIGLAQRIFPPIVTGSVVLLIGISLIKVGFNGLAGGFGAPDFGAPANLLLGLFVLVLIVVLHAYGRGFVSTVAIALGLVGGYAVAAALGRVHFEAVEHAAWISIPQIFRYTPHFDLFWLLPWLIAYLASSLECIGDLTATSAVSGEPVSGPVFVERLRGGLLADGVGCAVTAVFGALPKVTFAQNNGVIAMTRVASRSVGVAVAVILMVLGVFPKLAALVSVMPQPVLGGATVVLFSTVAVAGFDIIQSSGFTPRKHFILAVTMALGIGVTMVPDAVAQIHKMTPTTVLGQMAVQALGIVLESGLTVGALTAITLNLILPADVEGVDPAVPSPETSATVHA